MSDPLANAVFICLAIVATLVIFLHLAVAIGTKAFADTTSVHELPAPRGVLIAEPWPVGPPLFESPDAERQRLLACEEVTQHPSPVATFNAEGGLLSAEVAAFRLPVAELLAVAEQHRPPQAWFDADENLFDSPPSDTR